MACCPACWIPIVAAPPSIQRVEFFEKSAKERTTFATFVSRVGGSERPDDPFPYPVAAL